MRIGLIVPGFSASAADWCIPALRHLARRLALTDHLRVIALRYPYHAARYRLEGFEVISLGGGLRRRFGTPGHWRTSLELLHQEHRREPFDVLHAFWATESGLLAALAGRVLRVSTLVSLAGGELIALPQVGYGDQRSAWERLKVATALRLASAVSAGSQPLVDLAQRRLRGGQCIRKLPLGVDLALFRPHDQPPPRARLVHAATLVPVKDQALLLRSLAELRRIRPDATLDIVGSGPLRSSLEQLAAGLGIQQAVRWLGERDHASLPAAYAAASLLVVTSRHEAQGMVVLEAGACGRPVVGTCVGVVPELAPEAAAVVPERDAVAFARAVDRMLDRTELTGRAARRRIERDFGLETCTDAFRGAYAELRRMQSG